MAFELLTGRLPFEQTSYVALARAHRESPLPLDILRSLSIAAELVEFIERCTNKSVKQRFASAQEAVDFLRSRGSLPSPDVRSRVCSLVRAQTVEFKQSFFSRNSLFFALAALMLSMWLALRDEQNLLARIRSDTTQVRTQLGIDLSWVERAMGFSAPATVDEAGLIAALRVGDVRTYQALLKLGADPSRPIPGDREGNSVMHLAAELNINVVLTSIHLGYPRWMDVSRPELLSVRNRLGETVLLRAVKLRQISSVRYLVSIAQAAAFQPDNQGYTPLLYAVSRGDSALTDILLVERAMNYLEVQDADGRTVTHLAALQGDITTLATLLKRKALALVRDREGKTPLMQVIEQPPSVNLQKTLKLLLADPGPQFAARDNYGNNLESFLLRAAPEVQALVESLKTATANSNSESVPS